MCNIRPRKPPKRRHQPSEPAAVASTITLAGPQREVAEVEAVVVMLQLLWYLVDSHSLHSRDEMRVSESRAPRSELLSQPAAGMMHIWMRITRVLCSRARAAYQSAQSRCRQTSVMMPYDKNEDASHLCAREGVEHVHVSSRGHTAAQREREQARRAQDVCVTAHSLQRSGSPPATRRAATLDQLRFDQRPAGPQPCPW